MNLKRNTRKGFLNDLRAIQNGQKPMGKMAGGEVNLVNPKIRRGAWNYVGNTDSDSVEVNGIGNNGELSAEPISMTIQNTTTTDQPVVLFGVNADTASSNYGNAAAIVVSVNGGAAGTSYGRLLRASLSNPMIAKGVKFSFGGTSQRDQTYYKTFTDPYTGETRQKPFFPTSWVSEQNQNDTFVTAVGLEIQFDAFNGLSFTLLGSNTLTMYFFPVAAVMINDVLRSNNAVKTIG